MGDCRGWGNCRGGIEDRIVEGRRGWGGEILGD